MMNIDARVVSFDRSEHANPFHLKPLAEITPEDHIGCIHISRDFKPDDSALRQIESILGAHQVPSIAIELSPKTNYSTLTPLLSKASALRIDSLSKVALAKDFPNLPNIRHLDLYHPTNSLIDQITMLTPNAEWVALDCKQEAAIDLSRMNKMLAGRLNFDRTKTFADAPKLPQSVTDFEIGVDRGSLRLSSWEGTPRLKHLSISGRFDALPECCPQLKSLRVYNTPIRDIKFAENCSSLETLAITCAELKSIAGIEKLVNLHRLELTMCPVLDIKPLEQISLKVGKFQNSVVSVPALKEAVKLYFGGLSSAGSLRDCRELEYLGIEHIKDQSFDVSLFHEFPKLRWLELGENINFTSETLHVVRIEPGSYFQGVWRDERPWEYYYFDADSFAQSIRDAL